MRVVMIATLVAFCSMSAAAAEPVFDPGGMTQMRILPLARRKANQSPGRLSVAVWPTAIIDADRTHYLVQDDVTIMMFAIGNPEKKAVTRGWLTCDLPAGVELAGTNAQLVRDSIVRTSILRDGQPYTRYRIEVRPAKHTWSDDQYAGHAVYQAPSIWLGTNLSVGADAGRIFARLTCQTDEGDAAFESEETWVNLRVLPALASAVPRLAKSGLMGRASISVEEDDEATSRVVTRLIANMGCTYYFDGPSQRFAPAGLDRWTEGRNVWQANMQFRHNLSNRVGVGNGFYVHLSNAERDTMPPELAFITRDGKPRSGAVAPWALYTRHPWVQEHILDVLRDDVVSGRYESLWANWEPEAGSNQYMSNGDYSDGARVQFIAWSKLPEAEVNRLWPHDLIARHPDKWKAFRNWELGQWTQVLAETIHEASDQVGRDGRFIVSTVSDYMFPNQTQAAGHVVDSTQWGDFPYLWQTWTYYDVPISYERFPVSDRMGASMVVRAGVVARQLDKVFGADRQVQGGCVYGWDQGGWDLGRRTGFYLPEQLGFLHLSAVMGGLHQTGNYGEWPVFDGRYAHAIAQANARIARWEEFILTGVKQRQHVVIPMSPYPQVTPPHVRPQDQVVTPWENPNYLFSYEYVKDGRRLIAVANTWDLGECFFRLRVFGLDPDARYTLTEPEAGRLFVDEQGEAALSGDQLEEGLLLHVGATRWAAFVVEPDQGHPPEGMTRVSAATMRHAQRGKDKVLLGVLQDSEQTWGRERESRRMCGTLESLGSIFSGRIAVASTAAQAPTIDGRLDDSCWQQAATYGSFVTAQEGRPAAHATTWSAAHDGGRWLYLAIQCLQDMTRPVASVTEPDGPVWRDDSVEILLNRLEPRHDKDYLQVVVNSAGAKFDQAAGRREWNGISQWAVQRGDSGWTVELAIPLDDPQSLPASAGTLGFNMIRNVQESPGRQAESSAWYPVWTTNSDRQARGILVFQ